MKIKIIIASFLISVPFSFGYGQLNLDSCYALAKRNFPLIKQVALIEQSKEYNLDNASKGYLPSISLNGQATYQSAVTGLPFSLPNMNIEPISKDQYKLYAEINQPITDLLVIKEQKNYLEANAEIEKQKVEVELYKVKERINSLYFGILIIDAQLMQIDLLKKDINQGIEKINVAITNGVAIKNNADLLKAELLKADQKTIELKSARTGFLNMLSLFINQPLGENTTLEKPVLPTISETISRPELKLFDYQKQTFSIQEKFITIKNLPHLNFFLQSGYGRPALNFLSNDFDFYYYGGLRLNWNLSGFYTSKKEKELLTVTQKTIDVQNETFLFNTKIALTQQSSEMKKYQELIATDTEIIDLRESIKKTSQVQLEEGIITSMDYINYVNAEDQAKQNKILHQLQFLMAQYNYQITTGN